MGQISGPDFLCIGAQKAGTGWLYEQLRSHPDFWMPPFKEIHYFDRLGKDRSTHNGKGGDRIDVAERVAVDQRDKEFLAAMKLAAAKSEVDFALYAQLFEPKGNFISGDITPGYSTLPDQVVREITEHLAQAKVIFIARDPVERAWSQLSMWVRHEVIERFNPNDVDALRHHLQLPGVMARSFPTKIVRRWRQFVRPELFRVYFFDDLIADPEGTRDEIITYLGGDAGKGSGGLPADHNPKASKEKLPLNENTRRQLAKFFQDELKACASELGGAAGQWPARYGL